MKLIPSIPKVTNSPAERKVFDRLGSTFSENDDYVAYHSLGLASHYYKKIAEADFVVVGPAGVLVIEVKGGGVRCSNGKWLTVGKSASISINDPFEQVKSAMYTIKTYLEKMAIYLPNGAFGYGVVFPDVFFNQVSIEWTKETVCDARGIRKFETWISRLFDYWRGKSDYSELLSIDQLQTVQHALRPNFEFVNSLFNDLSKLSETAITLTEEQYLFLDIASANKRVICSGAAGTGKTLLALELARRLSSESRQVLFLCKSGWLRHYLSTKVTSQNLIFSTIDSVHLDMRRSYIDIYDALIVDEGQDLFEEGFPSLIDQVIKDGCENGEWYIFHDIDNQAGLLRQADNKTLEYLISCRPAEVPLRVNCRNTLNILNEVQSKLKLDMGVLGMGIGPKVRRFVCSMENSHMVLVDVLRELAHEGVLSSSITILSPKTFECSSVYRAIPLLDFEIIQLDEYSVRNFPISQIGFSEIKHFKGLENEVVVVVDLATPSCFSGNKLAEYYVAMTRARGLLCTLWAN